MTPTSSPTFNWVGGVSNPQPHYRHGRPGHIKIVAHEDPTASDLLPGEAKYMLDVTYYPQTSTFLKYGINAQGGGSGSIDKSLSLLWQLPLSGVSSSYIPAGFRVNTLKLAGQAGKPLVANVNGQYASLYGPTGTPLLTTPTYATDPGTKPWNFDDGGSSNVTIGGTWYDTVSIEADFARNLKPIWTMQSTNLTYLPPANRMVTGTIKNIAEAGGNIGVLEALTEQTLVWVLKSGTSTLTVSNVSFRKLSDYSIKADDVLYETYGWEGRGAVIT